MQPYGRAESGPVCPSPPGSIIYCIHRASYCEINLCAMFVTVQGYKWFDLFDLFLCVSVFKPNKCFLNVWMIPIILNACFVCRKQTTSLHTKLGLIFPVWNSLIIYNLAVNVGSIMPLHVLAVSKSNIFFASWDVSFHLMFPLLQLLQANKRHWFF